MDKKSRTFIIVCICIMLTVAFSYGYYELQISGNNTDGSSFATRKRQLLFNETSGYDSQDLTFSPGEEFVKDFTVSNNSTSSEIIDYSVIWEVLKNTFDFNEFFQYSITCSSNQAGGCNGLEETILPSTGAVINILDNEISPGEVHTYHMNIIYKEAYSINQTTDKVAVFNGKIGIKEFNNADDYQYTLNIVNGNTSNKYITINSTDIPESASVMITPDASEDVYLYKLDTKNDKVNASYDMDTNVLTLSEFSGSDAITIVFYTKDEILALADNCNDESLSCYLRKNASTLGLTKIFHEPFNDLTFPTVSYRYQGDVVANNYIKFGQNDLSTPNYRIIGVMPEFTSVDLTSDNIKYQVKLIEYGDYLTSDSWNEEEYQSFQDTYLYSKLQEYVDNQDSILPSYKPLISDTVLFMGDSKISDYYPNDIFYNERNLEGETPIISDVSLMYLSDFYYSFNDYEDSCGYELLEMPELNNNPRQYSVCYEYSWLYEFDSEFFANINFDVISGGIYSLLAIDIGSIAQYGPGPTSYPFNYRPTIYLKEDTRYNNTIISDGTYAHPYYITIP